MPFTIGARCYRGTSVSKTELPKVLSESDDLRLFSEPSQMYQTVKYRFGDSNMQCDIPVVGPPRPFKVASGGDLASLGASFANLANYTSSLLKLPPALQTYVDSSLGQLSGVTDYLESATGYSPTTIYTTAGAIVLLSVLPAVAARTKNKNQKGKPGKMSSRYGWSSRPGLSPFNSTLADGTIPNVTDDDFSYITSEDLENHGVPPRGLDVPHSYRAAEESPSDFAGYRPEDDIMLIKHRSVTYPEHFPAYSIGDGKLLVSDVIERVIDVLRLPERHSHRIRLFYKGRELKILDAPVRQYGVKNNSEVMVSVVDSVPDSGSDSSEEIVVVGREGREEHDPPRSSRRKDKGKKDRGRRGGEGRSPRDSGSTLGVPVEDDKRRGTSRVRTQSPSARRDSAPVVPGGPIDKINNIASHFNTKLLPLCLQYTVNPPSDPKKREEEHRKLSETVMLQVLLKLDEIDTGGNDEARAKRKALVQQVQNVLKGLDEKVKA
ncbi:BAG domain-containing protein [Apodospora peruviana]|uniref:BAG domain-containing protein n=1 Tax=Apodospora peruviana TaxID=516989 RepID=A0AAE0MB57_9PEZI|nr:BAG domain-containing protein [Apodospora peruviana]